MVFGDLLEAHPSEGSAADNLAPRAGGQDPQPKVMASAVWVCASLDEGRVRHIGAWQTR